MKRNTFLGYPFHCQILYIATTFLFMLVWSIPAFCQGIESAIRTGDLERIEALLKENPKLASSYDTYGTPLLHHAQRNRDVFKLLLAQGADINVEDEDDMTLLHWAARRGDKDFVEFLLANGADVNIKVGAGNKTPLHEATEKGHKEIVELLLDHGAEINAMDGQGYTPMYYAVSKDRKDISDVLIAHMAESESNLTPFYLATMQIDLAEMKGDLAKVEILLKDNPELVNSKDDNGRTLLHYVAQMGYKDVAELLLAKGADVNATRKWNRTPLHDAAVNRHKDIVEVLLANKAKVDAKDYSGETPLHQAATMNENKDVVELLLDHGAEINGKSYSGATPLHKAARGCSKDVAELLLAKGADINATDNTRMTPIGVACGAMYMKELLRRHGGTKGIIIDRSPFENRRFP